MLATNLDSSDPNAKVTIGSTTIKTKYGYAATMAELLKATDLKVEDSSQKDAYGTAVTNTPDFLYAGNTTSDVAGADNWIAPLAATSTAACKINYSPASSAGGTPILSDAPNDSTNC